MIMCILSWLIIVIIKIDYISAGKKIIVPLDYKSIQSAINNANEGDTVYVMNSVYRENIVLADHIFLLGKEPDKTIIRGNTRDPVVRAANYSSLRNFTIERGGTGILSENTNMVIQNNIIRENRKTGIHCLISLPHIQNNIIADNEWSGIYCELVAYGSRTAIEHNIIADNGYSGISLSRKSGVLVQNNVLYQNKQYGIFVSKDSRKSRIIYNDFFNNRRNYNGYAVIDATNISKDPQFPLIQWSSFNFLSNYNSPLIDLGKNGSPIGIVNKTGLIKLFKDSDEDAIADNEDKCPDISEDFDGFEDEDGCPENDNDEDGLYDSKDQCPNDAEDFDGHMDRDGCPDIDNDNDNIPDKVDKCPNRPETYNDLDDEDGCPDNDQ